MNPILGINESLNLQTEPTDLPANAGPPFGFGLPYLKVRFWKASSNDQRKNEKIDK